MSIHSTVDNIRKRRASYVERLGNLMRASDPANPVLTGVRVYEQMVEARWQIDAVDYVLSGFEDGVNDEAFLSVLEGVQRDLISAGSSMQKAMRSEPEAYWMELGKMERDMRMDAERIKRGAAA